MKITIQIPDDLAEIYQDLGEKIKRTLHDTIVLQLERHQKRGPRDQFLVLEGAPLGRLYELLGAGSVDSPEKLADAVSRLAQLSIGKIHMPLSPKEWERIAERAEKQGRPLQAYCKEIADTVLAEALGYR